MASLEKVGMRDKTAFICFSFFEKLTFFGWLLIRKYNFIGIDRGVEGWAKDRGKRFRISFTIWTIYVFIYKVLDNCGCGKRNGLQNNRYKRFSTYAKMQATKDPSAAAETANFSDRSQSHIFNMSIFYLSRRWVSRLPHLRCLYK